MSLPVKKPTVLLLCCFVLSAPFSYGQQTQINSERLKVTPAIKNENKAEKTQESVRLKPPAVQAAPSVTANPVKPPSQITPVAPVRQIPQVQTQPKPAAQLQTPQTPKPIINQPPAVQQNIRPLPGLKPVNPRPATPQPNSPQPTTPPTELTVRSTQTLTMRGMGASATTTWQPITVVTGALTMRGMGNTGITEFPPINITVPTPLTMRGLSE